MSTLSPLPDFDFDAALASLSRDGVDMTPVSVTNTKGSYMTATIPAIHRPGTSMTLVRHDESGRLEGTTQSGHITAVIDEEEFDFHVEASDDRDLTELIEVMSAMRETFGYEPIPEEECPPTRNAKKGTTTWYLVPIEPVAA